MNNHDKLKELSESLLFNLNDDEIESINKEFNDIINLLNEISSINVDNHSESLSFIEPIRLENVINDDEIEIYDSNEVFSNCSFFKNGMVVLKNEK